jgi:hypothetical protein
MKIFRIENDVDHYRYLLPEEQGCLAFRELDGTPKAEAWSPPNVRICEPQLEIGNFYNFGNGFLIADLRATEALCTLFEMAGELLPLPFNGDLYTVLNVTECINCLDHEKTTWIMSPEGRSEHIDLYMFKSYHLSESPIFKIPEESSSAIFVVEGLMEPAEEFREIVKRERLKGLVFHEVWSSGEE